MPPFQNDPLPLHQWLNHQPAGLREILSHAQKLTEINRGLHQWSQEPWLTHIQLANIRDGTLVLYSSSAAALVLLRNRQSALLDYLNQRYQIDCMRIEAKVRPGVTNPT